MGGKWTRWLLRSGAATLALSAGVASAAGFRHHQDYVLGTSFDLVVSTASRAEGERARDAALAEIARLDPILSNWRSDSELAALNASSRFQASPDLFAVVARAERVRASTRGYFSPRLGALSARWREAQDAAPSSPELAVLARAAHEAQVDLDAGSRTITRPQEVRFDLDAAAKGYVIDRALQAARDAAPKASGFMLNIGGDIATWGAAPDGQAWRVGVAAPGAGDNATPDQTLNLRGHTIAVSGAGARDIEINGARYPHLIAADGGASRQNRQAAVIAPTTEQADALATALAVMPAREGLAFIDALPNTAAQIIDAEGRVLRSDAWSMFVTEECQAAVPAMPWPDAFAVSVSFEVPRVTGTTKPYIAIWITDAQGRLVRTLLVVGDKPRWRETNYVFWRRVERMDLAGIAAIARPSRAPGRYDVVWDGRDNAGRPVGQGRYNLNVEAAREHGSHNFQAIPLTLSAAPAQADVAAQGEMGAVQVRYGRPS